MNVLLCWLICIGLVFHIVYLFSIFDIYFCSPLVHGMPLTRWTRPAPASRLVLFVADGLRADKIFEYEDVAAKSTRAPFLRGLVEQGQARFGVSHTRVPTESRPGHVALIAGFYEDVSAVTKGWKLNPVQFDSLFNESRHAWSFGSPDILPMFHFGATDPCKIEMFMYDAEEEDFSKDGRVLDRWVFERFDRWLESAAHNATLGALLAQDRCVIFLHLLGIDTNGHAHRPYSKEYLENIRYIDREIEKVVRKLDAHFADGKTAYVFTSDHGMNNKGAHGDGDPDNTRTPLIAWGSGIRALGRRDADAAGTGHDTFSEHWGLSHVDRVDLLQADIAPLMAFLAGIPLPMNSVGQLPLPYLDLDAVQRVEALWVNALQIYYQYERKESLKRATEFRFRPYREQEARLRRQLYETLADEAQGRGDYAACEKALLDWIAESLEGLLYLQKYNWLLLRSVIAIGYLGWMVYSALYIFTTYTDYQDGQSLAPTRVLVIFPRSCHWVWMLLVCGVSYLFLFFKQSPLNYYLYFTFPIYFWASVLSQIRAIGPILRSRLWSWKVLIMLFAYLVGVESLALSYFRREILSFFFLAFGLWPFFERRIKRESANQGLLLAWAFGNFSLAIFPMLSVEMERSPRFLQVGTSGLGIALVVVLGGASYWYLNYAHDYTRLYGPAQNGRSSFFLMAMALLTAWLVYDVDHFRHHAAERRLPEEHRLLGWALLALSSAYPFVASSRRAAPLPRLVSIFLSYSVPFILLSISYELVFYALLGLILFLWIRVESSLASCSPDFEARRYLTLEDGRLAFFFLFLIHAAFFGTGNVASLSSFSIESVYRLIVKFDPFVMGTLLIYKLAIPFLLLASVFQSLSLVLALPPYSLFLFSVASMDMVTLTFFFLVQDSGSWLEIGLSISHFCITNAFILFTNLLFLASQLLLRNVALPGVAGIFKKSK